MQDFGEGLGAVDVVLAAQRLEVPVRQQPVPPAGRVGAQRIGVTPGPQLVPDRESVTADQRPAHLAQPGHRLLQGIDELHLSGFVLGTVGDPGEQAALVLERAKA